MRHGWMTAVLAAASSACALNVGGGSPVEYTMVAIDAQLASSAQVAAQMQQAGSDFAMVIAAQDEAWFTELASATQLGLSGPGRAGDLGLAFLSRLELLGDTAITLGTGAAQAHVQDALYQIEEERYLDLMLVRLPAGADVSGAARALLEYIATDVMANASVVMALSAASPADAQRMDDLLRAAFTNAVECGGLEGDNRTYRIFFGPPARTRCTDARPLEGAGAGVVARISVGLRQ